jgi:hypothetical protein
VSKVIPGRFTAQVDGPFVVFIIGMRVNRFWQFWKWLPVAAAMGPMLKTLYSHPEKGFLGAELCLIWRGPMLVQYWRSFEDLERFAHDADDPHLEPWRRFNRRVGSNGSVGIFHETYLVAANQYEALYGNMPVFGLARATKHVPAIGNKETARRRLGLKGEPAAPSPPQP